MKKMKKLCFQCLFFFVIFRLFVAPLAFPAFAQTGTYWFRAPVGVPAYYDRNGAIYNVDSNGLIAITNLSLLKDVQGAGFTPLSNGADVVLLKDTTSYQATGASTTVNGSTLTLEAGLLQPGRSLRVTVYGTIAGTGAAKGLNLVLGTGAVTSPRFVSSSVGNFKAEFIVQEYTDTAHQQVNSFMAAGTVAGATTGVVADNQAAEVNMANAETLQVQVYSNNASDTVTQTSCIVELLP